MATPPRRILWWFYQEIHGIGQRYNEELLSRLGWF